MAAETAFVDRLRAIAGHPGARELLDDAAVLDVGGATLVLTHDMLVEGVHFLPGDPPGDVAWKLVAVNLSDLAAKGARPLGALMGYVLTGEESWDTRFTEGLAVALREFGVPLLGGDTVRAKERALGLTMIGEASGTVPARSGARGGDALFVTGTIGDAGLGLEIARLPEPVEGESLPLVGTAQGRTALRQAQGDEQLLKVYRRPQPQLEAGALLAPCVTAMMDVSDGLLIDARWLADASGVAALIELDAVPLSEAYVEARGQDRAARLAAATAGDDYQLLFTSALPLPALPELPCPVTRIGRMVAGSGLLLRDTDGDVPLPATLGWEHS